jgi:hypothetical protein
VLPRDYRVFLVGDRQTKCLRVDRLKTVMFGTVQIR